MDGSQVRSLIFMIFIFYGLWGLTLQLFYWQRTGEKPEDKNNIKQASIIQSSINTCIYMTERIHDLIDQAQKEIFNDPIVSLGRACLN